VNHRGLGTVYLRKRIWWIQYSFRGVVYRESSKSRKESVATQLLKKRLGEMGRGQLVGHKPERLTFGDLAKMLEDDYQANGRKSLDRARLSIAHLRGAFERSLALDISTDRIVAYTKARLVEEGAKPATVQNELAALKRMFNLAVRAGKLPYRPHVPSIEVRNTRAGFFEAAQIKLVLAYLRPHLRPLVEFGYLTGWRLREIVTLRWSQVDMDNGIVRLEPGTTKNDEGRVFPVHAMPRLASLLKAQRSLTSAQERASDQIIPWVFHRSGKPIRDFRYAWIAACKKAGVPGGLFHDLRRTAVRNLERAGVARSVAMKLTGHKTESVYRRYAIVSEADLSEGVRKLAVIHEVGGVGVELEGDPGKGTSTELTQSESERIEAAEGDSRNLNVFNAGGGTRTPTGCKPYRILSPARLPVSPLRRIGEI